ncbi:hypothetical protein B7486_79000, partial [cyanobacterium TDX16]
SNDSFQEFHGEHTWLFDDGRLIGGKPVPDVGWVFLPRTPVRGPTSRRATRDAGRAAKTADNKGAPAEEAESSSGGSGRSRSRGRGGRGRGRSSEEAAPAEASESSGSTDSGRSGAGRSGRAKKDAGPRPTKAEPLNDPLPFIEFVGANPVGSTVTGEVERFTSHGAHV